MDQNTFLTLQTLTSLFSGYLNNVRLKTIMQEKNLKEEDLSMRKKITRNPLFTAPVGLFFAYLQNKNLEK